MKTKNSDIAVKIFLVVVAVILVGLIIAWSMGVFKDKKKDLDDGTARINNAISSMAEFDLLVYDGGTITGGLLLELIEEKADGSGRLVNIDIEYKVLQEGSTDINPNGLFKGKVERDDNGVINKLEFTQQK